MKKTIALVVMVLGLAGCGYKPVSHMVRETIGESVSTEVKISLTDPENSVLIRDAVNQAILTEFGSRLVPKGTAQTHIAVTMSALSFIPLQRDSSGYIVYYRTVVSLTFVVDDDRRERQIIETTGSYDFPIEPSSIISDTKRFESIRESSAKAIDQFVARLAISGRLKH